MSEDNSLDDVDQRKLVGDTPHQEGVWTEIGTAEVTVDMFGHARVHVIREHEDAKRRMMMFGIAVALLAGVAAVYMLLGKTEPQEAAVSPLVPPAAPVIVESAVLAPVMTAPAVVPPHVSKPKAVVRDQPTVASPPAAPSPVVAKPVVPVSKHQPVITESVPPAVKATQSELMSPIQSVQPGPLPAKPQGDITY